MSKVLRLKRLAALAEMQRAHDMVKLSRLASARDETRAKLDKLSTPLPLSEDPGLFAARQAHLAWANAQRMQLNQTLALQTARLLEQRAKTARSFGRAEALSSLATKRAQRGTHSP